MGDQDVDTIIESLAKKHPKTYKKVREAIEKVAEESGDEYDTSYRSGVWMKNHQDELPEIYEALSSAISEGWSVGTSGAAYKYQLDILESIKWMGGAYIDRRPGENGLLWLHIPLENLTDEFGLGDISTELDRRSGFESEFDEMSCYERFHEQLDEQDYAVD